MMLSTQFLARALPYAVVTGESTSRYLDTQVGVCIDSRVCKKGQFFIALQGARQDGHDFVADVLAAGAAGVLVMDCWQAPVTLLPTLAGVVVVRVPDTTKALFDLARAWRALLPCTVVGVTGSMGKTSTKEMLRAILDAAGVPAYVSEKNYNTTLGIAYNLLQVPLDAAVAVFEVGISVQGEMAQNADLLRPTIGLITCVAHAHLQGLGGTLQAVAYEKRQLFMYLEQAQIGIVSGDQPLLADVAYHHPVMRFGLKTKNNIQARKVSSAVQADGLMQMSFLLKCYEQKMPVTLHNVHPGMVNNALAAASVATLLGISLPHIVQGLQGYQSVASRFELKMLRLGKGRLINDCYNANPESMRTALLTLDKMQASGTKVAVLGDMLELGYRERYWHRHIGRVLSRLYSVNHLILVGARAQFMARGLPAGLQVHPAVDWADALRLFATLELPADSLVLVKASHGMQLERLVDQIAG